jgi:hypothetical protein
MKKFIHLITLVVFGFACFCIWGVLSLLTPYASHATLVPAFTTLCINLRAVFIVLPIIATVYCVGVWIRKADRVPSWIGFFATATGVLVTVGLPAMIAAYLPLISALSRLATN